MFSPGHRPNAPSYSSVETFTNNSDPLISNRLLGDAYEPKRKRLFLFSVGWISIFFIVIGQLVFFMLSQRGFIYVEKDGLITTGVIMSINNTITTICISVIAGLINRARLWTFRAQLRKRGLSWKILKRDVFPNQVDTLGLIPHMRQLGTLHSIALISSLLMVLIFPLLQTSYKWVAATMESPRSVNFTGIQVDMWQYHREWLSIFGFVTIDRYNEQTLGPTVDAQVNPHKNAFYAMNWTDARLSTFSAERIPIATFSSSCRYPENLTFEAEQLTNIYRVRSLISMPQDEPDELEGLDSRMIGNLYRLKSVNGSSTATNSSYTFGFLDEKMANNYSSMDLEITRLELKRPKTKLFVKGQTVSAENDEWEPVPSALITFFPQSLNSLCFKNIFVGANPYVYNLTGATNSSDRLNMATSLINSVVYGSFVNLNYYMSSPNFNPLGGASIYPTLTSTIDILRLQINPIVLIPVILTSLAVFALCFLIAIWQKKRDKIAPSWLGFLSVDLGDDFKRNLIYHTEAEDEDVVTLYTDGSVDKLPVIDLVK
ncbi:hypothetical protein HK098_001311 [Nowakowskiella sp. JEL0407]|nr:hypothetical protein HK098_001311 [Nowakowskiella sp. JEL0407]